MRTERHFEDALRRGAERHDARTGSCRQLFRERFGPAFGSDEVEVAPASAEEGVAHGSSHGPDALFRLRDGRGEGRVGAAHQDAEGSLDRVIRLQREAPSRPGAAGHVARFTFAPSVSEYALSSIFMASARRRATERPN
jgi:hypothetical protein